MTLDDIRLFTEVFTHGGVSQAARRNNLAQQTLSRRMINLEKGLGHELFERTTPIALTPAGNAFLNYAYEVMSLTSAVRAEMDRVSKTPAATVRIKRYATDSFFGLLNGVTESLRSTQPQVRLELVSQNGNDREQVLEGVIDIGFVREICGPGEKPAYERAGLAYTPLPHSDFELVLGVLEGHPLLALPAPTLADVAPYPIATPSFENNGPIPRAFERLFARRGWPLHVDMVVCHSMLEYYALARPTSVYVFNETYSTAALSTHRRKIVPLHLADGPYTVRALAIGRDHAENPAVRAVLEELVAVDAETAE